MTTLKAPANSCDCHFHIFDNRFPALAGPRPTDYPVSAYRLIQQRTGTTRAVVVSPRAYVTNHQCLLDAISQLGPARTRGVAVVHPTVSDAELTMLADAGIRGIRFTVESPAGAVTTLDMIEPLAKRVHALGWHVQIHMLADQIVENKDLLNRLAAPIVFDHMGRIPHQAGGTAHPAFAVMRGLIDKGRAWVKLSPTTFNGRSDGYATWKQMTDAAHALIKAAPERVVWGSDWPHRSEKEMPDDAALFERLTEYARDQPTLQKILVDNPATLYGF